MIPHWLEILEELKEQAIKEAASAGTPAANKEHVDGGALTNAEIRL